MLSNGGFFVPVGLKARNVVENRALLIGRQFVNDFEDGLFKRHRGTLQTLSVFQLRAAGTLITSASQVRRRASIAFSILFFVSAT